MEGGPCLEICGLRPIPCRENAFQDMRIHLQNQARSAAAKIFNNT
jgi:hypothetical protein